MSDPDRGDDPDRHLNDIWNTDLGELWQKVQALFDRYYREREDEITYVSLVHIDYDEVCRFEIYSTPDTPILWATFTLINDKNEFSFLVLFWDYDKSSNSLTLRKAGDENLVFQFLEKIKQEEAIQGSNNSELNTDIKVLELSAEEMKELTFLLEGFLRTYRKGIFRLNTKSFTYLVCPFMKKDSEGIFVRVLLNTDGQLVLTNSTVLVINCAMPFDNKQPRKKVLTFLNSINPIDWHDLLEALRRTQDQ